MSEVEDWVARIKEVCGSDLRTILHLHDDGRDIVFVRDDIDMPEERTAYAFEVLMLDLLATDPAEAWYDHGDLECVTRRFEDAVEFHLPLSATEGVAIAIDSAEILQWDNPSSYFRDILDDVFAGADDV